MGREGGQGGDGRASVRGKQSLQSAPAPHHLSITPHTLPPHTHTFLPCFRHLTHHVDPGEVRPPLDQRRYRRLLVLHDGQVERGELLAAVLGQRRHTIEGADAEALAGKQQVDDLQWMRRQEVSVGEHKCRSAERRKVRVNTPSNPPSPDYSLKQQSIRSARSPPTSWPPPP
jgi:hypothetical protein